MSRRIRLALIGVAILAIALTVFFLLINPMRGDIDGLRQDIEDENMKILVAQQELARAEDTRRQGRENQGRLLELAKMIPSDGEIPSLILQIQDLADKAGIDWIQVTPGTTAFDDTLGYGTMQISLTFEGGFYDISDFIYRAEQMVAGPGRLLAVKDVTLSPRPPGEGESSLASVNLGVSMSIWAFVMPPETGPTSASEPSATTGEDESGATTTTEP